MIRSNNTTSYKIIKSYTNCSYFIRIKYDTKYSYVYDTRKSETKKYTRNNFIRTSYDMILKYNMCIIYIYIYKGWLKSNHIISYDICICILRFV